MNSTNKAERFTVFFSNQGWASQHEFTDLDSAIAYARKTTFDCQIRKGPYKQEEVVGFVSYFSGWQPYSVRGV